MCVLGFFFTFLQVFNSEVVQNSKNSYLLYILHFERAEIKTKENTQYCLLNVLFMAFRHLDCSVNSSLVSTVPRAASSLV